MTSQIIEGNIMASETILYNSIKKVPREKLDELAGKKIYFGHQSVGFNIIDGIKQITAENPTIKFDIIETMESGKFINPIFAHSRIGENTSPQGKVDEFVALINEKIGANTDIVFLKLCYVDITAGTNINNLFEAYVNGMKKIREKNPHIKIVHFTVPLTISKTTWKTPIKQILGKKLFEYEDNIKRNEYNELLKREYGGIDTIFDIAAIEATAPDGEETIFTVKGKKYYSMYPKYSNDGGHLNKQGKQIVAERLLVFLATN